jgi:adenine-specific DNA-methyltransferase
VPAGDDAVTMKKIPKIVLSQCEWGHDDYSLRVENLPKAPPKPGQMDLAYGGGTDGEAGHGG